MRILFFAQAFLPIVGGAERFLDRLARELSGRGHEIVILAARVRGRNNQVDAPYRLLRYRKPFSKRYLPRHTIAYLLKACALRPPDCVHAHGAYPPGYSVATFSRMLNLPWTVRPIGGEVMPGEAIQNSPKLRARVRHTLLAANRVIAQSRELEELFVELGVDPERILRIPNGVDLPPPPPEGERAQDSPRIAAMGIFFRKKGFDVLIESFRKVRQRHPAAVLEIAGDGSERGRLRQQVEQYRLAGSVVFVGMLGGAAKQRFLDRASLFVSASRREPFSNANLEALAAGLPMVATAVGGNREIVESNVNGLLVPPEDPSALATAICDLLGDSGLRSRMGAASRAKAAEYSWSHITDRYESLYAELTRTRSRGH